MATREIKTRFALEGEQKFKSAMKDSANAIKLLNAQEKLAKAQFQQTGDAQKYLNSQTDILKQKIEEQKNAVAAAEAAIKSLTDNGVAKNSKQMQDWEMKLTNAQTALVRMETDLQNLGEESSAANDQTEELGTTLQSLDKKASLDAITKGIGSMEKALEGAVSKAKDLATELVNAMKNASAWADDLATQATVFGMDVETLQRMRNAAKLIDTDVETIISSKQKLEKAMKSGKDDEFALFGIHTKRYGEFRNLDDVFWETGDALMHMTDGLTGAALDNKIIERDTAAMEIFGRSWRELLPLFTAGREAYEEALNGSSVVSEEDVSKLTALDDAFQKLQLEFETLQRTILAQLAPALTELSDALTSLLKEFNEYLQTEEGQEKLAELREAVRGLFDGIKDIDFKSALDTAKSALDSLKSALEWIKNNKDGIIKAIEGIAIAWAGIKLTKGVSSVLQFLSGAKSLFGLGGGGGGNTGGGGGSDGVGGAPTVGIGTKIASGVKAFFSSGAAYPFIATAAAVIPAAVAQAADEKRVEEKREVRRESSKGLNATDKVFLEQAADALGLKRDAEGNLVKNVFGQNWMGGNEQQITDLLMGLGARKNQQMAELASLLHGRSTSQGNDTWLELQRLWSGEEMDMGRMTAILEDVADAYAELGQKTQDLETAMNEEAPVIESEAKTIGENTAIGVANGITDQTSVAVAAAQALAAAVTDALASALKIQSPSKVMAELGGYVSEGFADGITGSLGVVNRAAESMARAVTGGVSGVNVSAGVNGVSENGRMIDITLMIGPEELTRIVVPLVDDAMGEEVDLMRR